MNAVINHNSKKNQQIDQLEAVMLEKFPAIDAPIRNFFTDGLYAREMSAPAGAMITSMIHKTEHIFVVSKGSLIVWDDEGEPVFIEAPYIGITKAGTRRFAYVTADLCWTTFHANPNNENVEQIQERIIEKHDNKLLTEQMKNKMMAVKKQIEFINKVNY